MTALLIHIVGLRMRAYITSRRHTNYRTAATSGLEPPETPGASRQLQAQRRNGADAKGVATSVVCCSLVGGRGCQGRLVAVTTSAGASPPLQQLRCCSIGRQPDEQQDV